METNYFYGVDKSIDISIADHYMDGKDKDANNNLFTKVLDRLASEHNIGPSSLVIESKDSIKMKFK